MSKLQIQYVSPDRLRPYPGNARTHSRKQIKLIADSIKRFGFINPIIVTDDFEVVAGHGRLQAARSPVFPWARLISSWTRRPRKSRSVLVRKTIFLGLLQLRFPERAIFGSLARTACCVGMLAATAITPGCSKARAPTWC